MKFIPNEIRIMFSRVSSIIMVPEVFLTSLARTDDMSQWSQKTDVLVT